MAERRPLVVIDGVLQELPTEDTLPSSEDLNLDGGSAASIYLPEQNVDGGTASG